ncbi:hypothetical protein D3C72_798060 [compost metagenome]
MIAELFDPSAARRPDSTDAKVPSSVMSTVDLFSTQPEPLPRRAPSKVKFCSQTPS